jgi:hypothetical protein
MDAPVFRSWNCTDLCVAHPTKPFHGPGAIELRIDGSVNITVASDPCGNIDFHDVQITGKTDGGDEVLVEHASSHALTSSFSHAGHSGIMHFLPYQCEILTPAYDPTTVTHEVFHLKNARLIGLGSFAHGSSKVTLRGLASQKLVPGHISAEMKIEHSAATGRVNYSHLESLISLALRSLVLAPCHESFSGNTPTKTVLFADTRADASNAPLISLFGDATASFLNKTLTGYLTNVAQYDLESMIQYYVFAHTSHTLELQFIFASIFMEGLKFNWAKNVSELYQDIKTTTGTIRGFRTSPTQKNLSIEHLMNRLAAHLGYSASFTFVEDRNMLFHSGQSVATQLGHANPGTTLFAELYSLYDQMDDLLLRILGYSGEMYSPRNPNTALNFPSRTPVS